MSDEFCQECGAKITGKTGFCSECGAPINIEKKSNNINEANIQNTIDLESKLNKIAIVGYVSSILSFIFFSKLLMFGRQYTDLLSIPLAIIALGAAFYIISKSTKMRIHGVIILLILLALFGSQTIFSLYVYIAVIIIAAILLIRYFKNK